MKMHHLLLIVAVLLLTLGCRIIIETTSAPEDYESTVETAVALTITMRTGTYTPTSTPILSPTTTATPSSTQTSSPTATYQPAWFPPAWHFDNDNSEYLNDITIPAGTVLSPGKSFVKTWKVKNTGKTTWTKNYLLVLVGGNDMGGSVTTIDKIVYSGSTARISILLQAPTTEGTYRGYWKLADEDGNTFGDTLSVKIIVEVDATSTPTATPTSTSTVSPIISTPTIEATATVPSETPTPTPTPTDTPSP